MLIDHHDQQIVRRKTQNLELCFGTNVGTNQAKIEKISISRAIRLEFLRSLVSAIRCEANIESTHAKLVDMMSRIVARNRLCGGSLENSTCDRANLNT